MSPDNPIVYLVLIAAGWWAIWRGFAQPSGIFLPVPDRKAERDAHITELECANEMCEHMIDGTHPRKIQGKYGDQYWTHPAVGMWKVGTPVPPRRRVEP